MKIFASTLLAMGVAQAAALESSPNTDEQLAQATTTLDMQPMMTASVASVAMPTMAMPLATV
jgi:hypothetical protein